MIGKEREDVLGIRRAPHTVVRLFGELVTKAAHDSREPANIPVVHEAEFTPDERMAVEAFLWNINSSANNNIGTYVYTFRDEELAPLGDSPLLSATNINAMVATSNVYALPTPLENVRFVDVAMTIRPGSLNSNFGVGEVAFLIPDNSQSTLPLTITIRRGAEETTIIVEWHRGLLFQSTDLEDSWVKVEGATNPLTIDTAEVRQMFWQARCGSP